MQNLFTRRKRQDKSIKRNGIKHWFSTKMKH